MGRAYLLISSTAVIFIIAVGAIVFIIARQNQLAEDSSASGNSFTRLVPKKTTLSVPSNRSSNCQSFAKGDFDCNSVIDLQDYDLWQREFVGENKQPKSDVNGDGMATLLDYEVWREGYKL